MRYFLLFLIIPIFICAQSSNWNSIIDLNLSVPNYYVRTDLYTDKDGSHILIDNGSTLKYYLYSPTGSQIRSYTIDGSISSTYSKIMGWDENIYVSYQKGSTIYTKKSTNAGQNWSNINNISLDNSESGGLELWADDNGLHIAYSEWNDNNGVFETKYKLSEHDQSNWINSQTVSIDGGAPSITTSANRVHVGFISYNDLYTRDKYYDTWQTSQQIPNQSYPVFNDLVMATSGKLHGLYYEYQGLLTSLYYINRNLTGSTWSTPVTLAGGTGSLEYNKADMTVTSDGKLHMVYLDSFYSYYREWSSSLSNYYNFTSGGSNSQRISSRENDIYTIFNTDDGSGGYEIHMRQRDYAPLQLTNFAGSWSSNHPRIDWGASKATDFDEYIVQKKEGGGSWTNYETISNRNTNYFTDVTELKYSLGHQKTYVYYRVKQKDLEGNESAVTSQESFAVNAPQESMLPSVMLQEARLSKFSLYGNYPNPFNPETKIYFGLPEYSHVTIKLYNLAGKEVSTLINENRDYGYQSVNFNANNLPSGIFIYRMTATGLETGKRFSAVKRMVLIK